MKRARKVEGSMAGESIQKGKAREGLKTVEGLIIKHGNFYLG